MKFILVTLSVAFIIASTFKFAKAKEVDCSVLDPRASISDEKEAKLKVSAGTLFKIAKAGSSIEGRLKKEIQNLQKDVAVSEFGQIKLRTLYLFCEMVANAEDITIDKRVQLFNVMMNQKNSTIPAKKQKAKKVSKPKEPASPKEGYSQIAIQPLSSESINNKKTFDLIRILPSNAEKMEIIPGLTISIVGVVNDAAFIDSDKLGKNVMLRAGTAPINVLVNNKDIKLNVDKIQENQIYLHIVSDI